MKPGKPLRRKTPIKRGNNPENPINGIPLENPLLEDEVEMYARMYGSDKWDDIMEKAKPTTFAANTKRTEEIPPKS